MNKTDKWLLCVLALTVAQCSRAEDEKVADPLVKDALDRLKLVYTVTPQKNFQLEYTRGGNRKQNVFVNSNTDKLGGEQYRDITSTAYKVDGELDRKEACDLLADNDTRVVGGWRIVRQEGATYVIYALQAPVSISDQQLKTYIVAASNSADEKEKERTGKDLF